MMARFTQWILFLCLCAILSVGCKGEGGGGSSSGSPSLDLPAEAEPPGDQPAFPLIDHVDQARIASGQIRFDELFVLGDELFETRFNSLDGVGIQALPDGTPFPQRFSRVPPGGNRFTGPNGQACNGCHNVPFGTSAGSASGNVHQDPSLSGVGPFNVRNAISLFGSGLIQRLAEEMTEALVAIRDEAVAAAVPGGAAVLRDLTAKGVSFGAISVTMDAGGIVTVDTAGVEGVSVDLVVRPFGWKGDVPAIRTFTRGAARNELGMEADELVAKDPAAGTDPDGDGVEGELSVGDITAMAIYIAAQESPTTLSRMESRGFLPPSGAEFAAAAERGETLFHQIDCSDCHVSEMRLADTTFREPTRSGDDGYLDGDIDPVATFLDPARPATFDLALQGDDPRPIPHPAGGLRIGLFGDLKRHDMGEHLVDAQDTPVAASNGAQLSVGGVLRVVDRRFFLTAELWGVGNTGPYLHDGRAGTLDEAIRLHGVDDPMTCVAGCSEAQDERDAYVALSASDQEAVVTFLKSLILIDLEAE